MCARAARSLSVRIWPETKQEYVSPIVGAAFLQVWSRKPICFSGGGGVGRLSAMLWLTFMSLSYLNQTVEIC